MASAATLAFFLLIIIIINSSDVQARKRRRPSSSSTPEIWLSTFGEVDSFEETPAKEEFQTEPYLESDLVVKNGTDYVVFDATEYVEFTCQSRYPVVWSLTHAEQLQEIQYFAFETSTFRSSEFHIDSVKPVNKYFETLLTVHFTNMDFLSANFTCTATPDDGKMRPQSSSIHLFYAGSNAIERRDETIQVYVPPSKKKDTSGEDKVIFPCRPATPKVKVLLEKQMESRDPNKGNGTLAWRRFKVPTRYVDFDPKRGFIFLKDAYGKRSLIFGFYRCIAVEEEEDNDDNVDGDDNSKRDDGTQMVYINVTSIFPDNVSAEVIKFGAVVKTQGNGSVSYNDKRYGNHPLTPFKYDEMVCCSGVAGSLPKTYSERCYNRLQCDMLELSMTQRINSGRLSSIYSYAGSYSGLKNRSDCNVNVMYPGLALVCKADGVQFSDVFFSLFTKGLMPVANRSKPEPPKLTMYESESNAMRTNVSQKILLLVGHPITSDELTGNDHYSRYGGKVFTLSKYHYIEEDVDAWTDFDDGNGREEGSVDYDYIHRRIMHKESLSDKIAEYPRDLYYEKEPLMLVCLGWKFLYSRGALLTISWRNGTVTVVDPLKRSILHYRTVYFSGEIYAENLEDHLLEYRFGKQVLAHRDMTSVDCWMPQLNTGKWDKITKNLAVLPGSPPQFAEGEGNITEQVVYFYLGEEGRKLECRIVGGAPEPKMNLTKDGKGILDRRYYQLRSHDNSKIFNLSLETSDTQNDNGTHVVGDGVTMTILTISFAKITHDMQGVYQCTAENIRGKVTLTFRVVVKVKRGPFVPILMVIVGISVVLLIGLGLRYWRQQRNAHMLRRNGPQ